MRGEIVAFPTCLIASPKRESNKGMTKAVSNQEKISSEMEVVLPHKLYIAYHYFTIYTVFIGYTVYTVLQV